MTPRVRYDYIEDVPQDSISGVPFGGGIAHVAYLNCD